MCMSVFWLSPSSRFFNKTLKVVLQLHETSEWVERNAIETTHFFTR